MDNPVRASLIERYVITRPWQNVSWRSRFQFSHVLYIIINITKQSPLVSSQEVGAMQLLKRKKILLNKTASYFWLSMYIAGINRGQKLDIRQNCTLKMAYFEQNFVKKPVLSLKRQTLNTNPWNYGRMFLQYSLWCLASLFTTSAATIDIDVISISMAATGPNEYRLIVLSHFSCTSALLGRSSGIYAHFIQKRKLLQIVTIIVVNKMDEIIMHCEQIIYMSENDMQMEKMSIVDSSFWSKPR